MSSPGTAHRRHRVTPEESERAVLLSSVNPGGSEPERRGSEQRRSQQSAETVPPHDRMTDGQQPAAEADRQHTEPAGVEIALQEPAGEFLCGTAISVYQNSGGPGSNWDDFENSRGWPIRHIEVPSGSALSSSCQNLQVQPTVNNVLCIHRMVTSAEYQMISGTVMRAMWREQPR